jgi:hypothetical protein
LIEGGVLDKPIGTPHIVPDTLYPAVAGKGIDGSTTVTSWGTDFAISGYPTLKYYYTDIKGSKPIKDPRIGAHFGSQRHKIRSIQRLEQESATHGKNVYSIDGREWMKVVDDSSKVVLLNGNHGNFLQLADSPANCFIEVVGYFNNLNLSLVVDTNRCTDVDILVDGSTTLGVDGSSTLGGNAAASSPLMSRYVDSGSLMNTGLTSTLGIHTAKILCVGGGHFMLSGIELIAQDTTSTANRSKIQIPSQNVVSYGKKFNVSGTPHYDPFTTMSYGGSGTTASALGSLIDTATSLGMDNWKAGTSNYHRPWNGGRVVKWVDSSGTIKTSVTMMPPNAQNISATASNAVSNAETIAGTNAETINFDTTTIANATPLSEVAKTFHWREFGNGSANGNASYADASMLNTADDIAYVMDDGLTSISGDDVTASGGGTLMDISGSADGDGMYITFIGTGVTITNTYNGPGTRTVALNLPYGSHVLKYYREDVGGSTANPDITIDGVNLGNPSWGNYNQLSEITFHQPKLPPIPEDACVIADYMLMADFVPATSSTMGNISKGVRLNSGSRDVFYNSTAAITYNQSYVSTMITASSLYTLNAVSEAKLPAFGTAFGMYYDRYSDRHNNVHVKLDGSTFTYNSSNIYDTNGDWDDTNDDGTIDKSASNVANSLYGIKNQVLGLHTFGDKNEAAVSGDYNSWGAIEIATPIHTSSHYQTFETPFLHELVGGDRNMEQTNLVVSPDGKTWDQVTRDTSYMGRGSLCLDYDGGAKTESSVIPFDECRGFTQEPTEALHRFNKDFAIGYDRQICLRDGEYLINLRIHTINTSNFQDSTVRLNGVRVMFLTQADANNWTSVTGNALVQLKRGDYLQVYGGRWDNDAFFGDYNIIRMD